MFKLLKLCAYVALGYFVYELYQGMAGQAQQGHGERGGGGQQGGRGQQNRQQNQGQQERSPQQRGSQRVTAHDSGGAEATHTVGRGVVQR